MYVKQAKENYIPPKATGAEKRGMVISILTNFSTNLNGIVDGFDDGTSIVNGFENGAETTIDGFENGAETAIDGFENGGTLN